MCAKAKMTIPQEQLEAYDKVFEGDDTIERKGKTTPYTSLNGHMFTFMAGDGTMAIRLSEEDRESFIREFESELMEQHGRIMKEYVRVPGSLLSDTFLIKQYVAKSYEYVSSLKPKATKKKK